MTRCQSELNHPAEGFGWTAPTPVRCHLETPRLVVRAYTLDDAPRVYDTIRASMDHLMPWMPWAPGHTSLAFTTKYISEQLLAQDSGAKFAGLGVGVFERESGLYLGGTGVHDVRRDSASGEIGYWIRPDRVRLGYATEACARVLSWAFDEQSVGGLGLRRVRIYCSGANERSSRIPTKLGLTQEVRQREDYFVAGVGATDRLGWGVLRDEWDRDNHRVITPA